MNVAAALGACIGPLIIGTLTKNNAHTGWRYFYVLCPRSFVFVSILIGLIVDSNGTLGINRFRALRGL